MEADNVSMTVAILLEIIPFRYDECRLSCWKDSRSKTSKCSSLHCHWLCDESNENTDTCALIISV